MSSLHSISGAPPSASMGYRILTNVSNTPTLTPPIGSAATTTGVIEFHPSGALTSTYAVLITQAGEYSIVWDNAGVLVADDQPNLNSIAAGVPQTSAIAAATQAAVAAGSVLAVTNPVTLDLTQAVPASNTAQTVGDALNAARAQGFGKWVISGTTLTLYAANGTTVVKTFTLDSATAPTSRS